MADELLDLVDKKDNVIGTINKFQAHGNPDFIHREVAIVVFNDRKETLLQRRSLSKTNDPGEWKLSAAGHVSAGENPEVAVQRETYEELGIRVKPIFYKKVFRKYSGKNKIPESRFFWIFYAKVKGRPLGKVNADEVSEARWVKVANLVQFSTENDYSLKGLSHGTIMEIYNKEI